MPITGELIGLDGRPLLSEARQARRQQRMQLSQQIGNRLRARYDAAQTDRHNEKHWANADGLAADAAANAQVRRILRNRSRYEAANNSYCAGMLRTLANDTIGTGPSLNLRSGGNDATEDNQVETLWWSWSQRTRLAIKLRTMRIAKGRDGESFAAFITNPALRHPIKLDLRLYEADQIAAPMLGLSPLVGDTDGILLDDFGNVAGYMLLRTHPGQTAFGASPLDYVTVPARDMVHLFLAERAGQHRGVPEITPALPLYAQLRRYTLAVIAAAETAADLAAFIQTAAVPDDPDSVEPLDVIEIEKRMIMTLPDGYNISQLKAEQPTTTYDSFKKSILQEIARCLNMPFNVAAGDSSGYNYSSGRMDHQVYFKSIDVERSDLANELLDPLFERWWAEARLIPGLLPPRLAAMPEPPPHEWRWDGREHVDPVKEASAQQTRLSSLTTTLAREYAAQGLDWREQLDQIAAERRAMQELGLSPVAPAGSQSQQTDPANHD